MTVPLSVAMVCKDSDATIGRVLDSVGGLASEVVAVDSGSTDGTLGLLRAHDAKIIETEWRGYVATKQVAMDACAQPWTLLLDSDESLDETLASEIRRVIEGDDPRFAAYEMNRMTWYMGRPLRHVWQPEWRLRLFRTGRARQAGLEPHDYLELIPGERGGVGRLGGTLRHDSFATIGEHLGKQWSHARLNAKALHESGRRGSVLRMLTSPGGAVFKQIVLKGGWRDGWRGWAAAGSAAGGTLMKHLILLELSRSDRSGGGGSA